VGSTIGTHRHAPHRHNQSPLRKTLVRKLVPGTPSTTSSVRSTLSRQVQAYPYIPAPRPLRHPFPSLPLFALTRLRSSRAPSHHPAHEGSRPVPLRYPYQYFHHQQPTYKKVIDTYSGNSERKPHPAKSVLHSSWRHAPDQHPMHHLVQAQAVQGLRTIY
jgi:hypothetical protein